MASTTALRLVLVAALLTALVVAAGAWAGHQPAGSGPSTVPGAATEPVPPSPGARAAAVLRAWDAARSAAWAAGDVRRLGALYTPGSAAGRRDQEMLREWLRQGLVVRDLRVQVLALRQVSRTERSWVLEVTDRVAGAAAAGRGPATPLPRDAATTTTVTLRRTGGRWLVESVRGAGS